MVDVGLVWAECHPTHDFITLASQDGRLLQWNLAAGGVRQLAQPGRLVQARWSADGHQLLAVERGGQVLPFDSLGRFQGQVEVGFDSLAAACYDGPRLALGGSRQGRALARVGRLEAGGWAEEYQVELKQAQEVRSLVLLGETLVLGFDDGFFEAYREQGQNNLAGGQVFSGGVSSMALSPEKTHLAMGGNRGGLLTMTMDPWVVAESWPRVPPRPIAVNQLAFGARYLAAACSDDCTRIFDWPKGGYERELGTPFWLRQPKPEWNQEMILPSLCFDSRRPLLYLAHYLGGLQCWDLGGQQSLGTLRLDNAGHWRVEAKNGQIEEGSGDTPSGLWQAVVRT